MDAQDDDLPEAWNDSLERFAWQKGGRQWEHLAPGYLEHAAVKPLGIFRDWCFYGPRRRKVVALLWDDHTAAAICALFAHDPDQLMQFWGGEYSVAATGNTVMRGWIPSAAADSLRMGCCHAGIVFPPQVGLRLTHKGMVEGPVVPPPWGRLTNA